MLHHLSFLHKFEYAVIDRNWRILEFSTGLNQFADAADQVQQDYDIRLSFPEFVGIEGAIESTLTQQQSHFELKAVARSKHLENPLYLDLYIISYKEASERLIVFAEDVSDRVILEQKCAQSCHEIGFLLDALEQAKANLKLVKPVLMRL